MSERTFLFRKGLPSDIEELESIRIVSIQSCTIYSDNQRRIWSESIPNWSELIPSTLVCLTDDHPVGFAIAHNQELDFLYVHPSFHGHGIANILVSKVEEEGMRCDCNPYSEKVLQKRGWTFQKDNVKTKDGETFHNKWYVYQANH